MRFRAFAFTLLCSLIGCSESLGPTDIPQRDDSPLQTDALSYRLVRNSYEYRVIVQATLVNTTGAPIHYRRCMPTQAGPMFGMARTGPDSNRTFFVDWGWACVGGVPTGVLADGESVVVQVPFGSVDQPAMQPPLQPDHLVGQFRIYLDLCEAYVADSDHCVLLPAPRRQSSAFLIHY